MYEFKPIDFNAFIYGLPVVGFFARRATRNRLQAMIDLCGTTLADKGYMHNNQEYVLERVSKRGNGVYSWQYTSTSYTLYDAWNNEVINNVPSIVVDFLLNTGNVKEFTSLTGGNGLARRIEHINTDTGLTVSETVEFVNKYINLHPISKQTFCNDATNKHIVDVLQLDYLTN